MRNFVKKGIILLVIALTLFPLFSRAVQELQREEVVVKMGVMQGPSGFGTIGLNRNEGYLNSNTRVEMSVYPSPNEVVARLVNGELDFAALPTNSAANLYAKGVGIKTVATVGEGMLMFLTNDTSIKNWDDLANRKISIPGAGSTPDQMAKIITTALGFDYESDIELDYSIAAPAQVAQMLIAEKISLAVLPEPFVTLTLNSNKNVSLLLNIQELWQALTGSGNYPMTVIVVSDKFVENHKELLPVVMGAIEESINWVNSEPSEAALLIEEVGIMKAAMAAPAIPRANLVFRRSKEGKEAMDVYFKVLYGFDYTSIGGELPDEGFYLDY
ncbi:MAG: ABC transporter substrate-binding protein [Sphaerochaetaceae bacterium]|jgi:NitT/TauT family transport system substrate-binding protein|nr:ABC transporter substrate-binding protein [Sphaerochaetaceae bacterium]HHU88804.1 ABC transporter substrate-binding protein [Spirochaetales bacterium]